MFKPDSNKTAKTTEVIKVPNYGDQKIDEAKGQLEQIRRITNQTITEIKTNTDDVENKRRIQEDKQKRERANQIQNEVITSHKKNVEIDWNWQELEEKEDCKELDQDIKKQIVECQQIIFDKEKLKDQFEEAIKAKDKHYVKQMQQMNNHIDDLIRCMKKQFTDMRIEYSTQLSEIESEFERERAGLLKQNEEEIKQLFAKHQATEEKFLKMKTEQEEAQSADLENQKSQDANNQAEQKIKLEKEMQILEKCMEDMKAVYRLNEEKLDFNTKVLQERASVNRKTEDILKIRERKFREIVREVKRNYHTELTGFQTANTEDSNKFKIFTKQFKELQKKFERFEKSDNNRLKEIWDMNLAEAKAIVQKIMHADQVIHQQQLDIPWKPPSDAIFKAKSQVHDGSAANDSFKGADSAAQGSQIHQQHFNESNHDHTISKSDIKDGGAADQSQHTSNEKNNADMALKYEKIKNVFKMLIDEAEYLIDERAFERCMGASVKEQFSIKIDSIRKSLGIENMGDVQLLVDIFYTFEAKFLKDMEERFAKEMEELEDLAREQGTPMPPLPDNGVKNLSQVDLDNEEKDPAKLNLNPDHLVMVLNQFHQKREENAIQQQMLGTQTKKKANFESEEQKAEREKNAQKQSLEKLTTILSEQKLSVWTALDKTLSSYYGTLVKRQNLIEETGLLNQQNEELKTLLNQYLQAGVNQELQVPPTQVIRLDI